MEAGEMFVKHKKRISLVLGKKLLEGKSEIIIAPDTSK